MTAVYCAHLASTRNPLWTRDQDLHLKEWYGRWQVDPMIIAMHLKKKPNHVISRLRQLNLYRGRPTL